MNNLPQFHQPHLRVLALTPGLHPGGAEIWLSTLVKHSMRVKYHVIAFKGGAVDLPAYTGISGTEQDMVEAVKETTFQYDAILYWGLKKMDLAFTSRPVILCQHGSKLDRVRRRDIIWLDDVNEGIANFYVGVSESSAANFEDRRDVAVIHNGSDLERVAPVYGGSWQREQWQIPQNAKVMLFNGRLYPFKGADIALQALKYLPDEWVLVIHGHGKQEPDLKDTAEEMGRHVIFAQPRLRALGDLYAASDVVVIPSHSEAFPLVLIEAWQAGVPVVASEFKTMGEIRRKYTNGLQMSVPVPCPPAPEQVAAAVLEASKDDPRTIRAQEIARTHFTASAMVGRWERYLYDCVQRWHHISFSGFAEVMK